jgi:hypothetical protein
MGSDLMQMGKSLYSSDVSKYVGQLDYNTGVNTVNGQMASQQMAAQSAWDTTVASSLSNVYSSYLNGQISLAEAQAQANAAIQQAQINANATAAAASASAQAQRDAANINAAAQQAMTKAQLDANTASTQAATSSSYVTDLINNVGSNAYTPEQGKSILQGYLTSGYVSQGDYNMAKGYFDSLIKNATPTTTTPSSTTSSSSTAANKNSSSSNLSKDLYDWYQNPPGLGKLLFE